MRQILQRLLRQPIYAISVMLVLGIGIGLGGAYCLYGIVDSVLFRPLRIANAGARYAPGGPKRGVRRPRCA